MQLGRVVGTLVATKKNGKLEGATLLLVQPIGPDDRPHGTPLLAVDSVGAGSGERVLIVIEGRAAGEAVRSRTAPVDVAIVGIVDHADVAVEQADLDEETLRVLVREALARHLPGHAHQDGRDASCPPAGTHPSHRVLAVRSGRESGGPCLIEPAVPCTHCGYCQSLGH